VTDFPWLTVLIVLPLIAAVVALAVPSKPGAVLAKQVALLFSLLTLAASVAVAVQ